MLLQIIRETLDVIRGRLDVIVQQQHMRAACTAYTKVALCAHAGFRPQTRDMQNSIFGAQSVFVDGSIARVDDQHFVGASCLAGESGDGA
jgi:hypothetical protein